jgi:ribosome production factor 2
MHFASELFETHPRFIQLKSLLLDFFGSEVIDGIHQSGLEHVISVSLAPAPPTFTSAAAAASMDASTSESSTDDFPLIHLRTYTVSLAPSGTKIPRVELTPMGPFLDLRLRRHQPASEVMWKAALKQPKLKKQDVEKGLGKRKKNVEVDEMGDLRGRLHVGKQDLSRLQTRKMKGLKDSNSRGHDESDSGSGSGSDED